MISHYFKLARITVIKNKYYALINVFGLVCGMLSALIIAKYIGGSLYFDNFHDKKDRIYSIIQEESLNGNPQQKSKATYWGSADVIKQYPEVQSIARYNGQVEYSVQIGGEEANRQSFRENKVFATDSGFLEIFTFPFIHGNPANALSRINSVVITNSTSRRYFGNANPVGKVLLLRAPWGEETSYEITGVMEDVPLKSRFRFDLLITQSSLDPSEFWTVPECSTFVLLGRAEQRDELENKLTNALDHVDQLKATNRKVVMSLESIANIKLTSTEYLLTAVGVFIILISWINYINQVIAQSYSRIKQIGILRVMGSSKANLKIQFAVESSLICLTSFIMIIAIYLGLEPYLQSITSGHLLPMINDPTPINFIFLGLFIAGTLLATLIPSFILFTQNFAATLRNGYGSTIENVGVRKVLVIGQFSISTILMISIFVIGSQLEYMRSKDKGINMDRVLIVKDPMSNDSSFLIKRKTLELFKDKCAQLAFVSGVTSSTTVPGESYRHEIYLNQPGDNRSTLVHLTGVDDKFFDLYDVKFIAGHNFIPHARHENRKGIILTESAARAFGVYDLDKLINTKIIDQESEESYDLIGIVKDYHQTSLKYEIKPMAFRFNELIGHISLKITGTGLHSDAELEKQINAIKQIWLEVYHDAAFDCFFLDQKFQSQDAEDQYLAKLFQYFTLLSIVISCLGLFGLSLLISTKRNREVGIRKVFGATTTDILTDLSKGYFGSLCISVMVGSPVAYFLMNSWLQNFAYKIEIGFWPIFLSIFSLAIIFFLTVSYHVVKSSRANPVTILRD